VLNEEVEVTVTASTLDDGTGRATPDHAMPEAPRRDVPRELGDFPSAREASEEHPRGARAHATPAIFP
jgi:hypothetical protein